MTQSTTASPALGSSTNPPLAVASHAAGVIHLGSRRELFIDGFLIDELQNVRLSLKHPERREEFVFDAPWEDGSAFPYSVLHTGVHAGTKGLVFGPDKQPVRFYYRAGIQKGEDSEKATVIGILESNDGGVTFQRPNLDMVSYPGVEHNNIIGTGTPGVPPVFYDTNPDCPPDQLYKGLASYGGSLYAMGSPDGLVWRQLSNGPLVYSGAFDTVNTAFWDTHAKCYRSYTRVWVNKQTAEGVMRIRCIQSATSPDFINWTQPVENIYADGEVDVQLYTNATIPCPGAEHIYLAFPNRIMDRRWIKRGDAKAPNTVACNEGLFMASRDGVNWTRYLDAWVRPSIDPRTWTQRCNYPVWGIVQTSDTEWSMYVNEAYSQPDGTPGRLRRLSLRPYGFVSASAGYDKGTIVTKPFTFDGRCLRLNYETSASGHIRVEIQDEAGAAIPGFALKDMNPLFGNEIDGGVTWKTGSDLSALIGRTVRLRFELKSADLYGLRFSSHDLDVNSGEEVRPAPATYRTRALHAEVRVHRASAPPVIDGRGEGWDWSSALPIIAPDQYGDFCNAEVALMYDDDALYIAAKINDPHPMVNALRFDGDMRHSWTSDALQLHLRAVTDKSEASSESDINDVRMWYSTYDQAAGCCILMGKDVTTARVNPEGVQGAYHKRGDGRGYSLTYRVTWQALGSVRPAQAGERLTACIQCHWGTQDGRKLMCGAAEVRKDNAAEVYVAESWGDAVFE